MNFRGDLFVLHILYNCGYIIEYPRDKIHPLAISVAHTKKYIIINDKKGRRFIPTIIPFPKSIRDQFPEHFKLVKNAEGEYKLYISPMMKVSLEKEKEKQDHYLN